MIFEPTLEQRLKFIHSLLHYDKPITDGQKLAMMALSSKNDIGVIVLTNDDGELLSAMSYRVSDNSIKRINTGAINSSNGYGTALVRYLTELYPRCEQWCLSIAPKWCENLGMEFIEELPDGRKKYILRVK